MSTLIDNARQHIASLVSDLEGEDDFMPFMTIRNYNNEIIYAGIMMPDGQEAKDGVADTMTALCMIHHAAEVVFVSVSWMVTGDRNADELAQRRILRTPPSESPDRVEVVFLVQVDDSGGISSHSAPVIRENNTVSIGEWSVHQGIEMGGRFGDAIQKGMELGQSMPPEMRALTDSMLIEGRTEALVNMTLGAMQEARRQAGALRN